MKTQISHFQAKLHNEIDTWDFDESLLRNDDIIVVDARSEAAFSKGHIPGTVNIPYRQMNERSISHLNKAVLS